jgi:uncharacterized protein (TIGR02145 family)
MEWEKAGKEGRPAWCYYDNSPANGQKYGKLYNWYAISDPRGLIPRGWHLPTDAEWNLLADSLDNDDAGLKLRSVTGWQQGENGTNSTGFNAMPTGYRQSDGIFLNGGLCSYFWTSSPDPSGLVWYHFLHGDDANLQGNMISKYSGLSVRCIRN